MTEIAVKDIMTPVKLCLPVDSSIKEAIDALVKSEQTSACVCDQAGNIVGIFTEKEALKAYTNSIYFSESTGSLKDSMTKGIISVDTDDLITKVALIFVENGFHQVPVLKDGQIEGEIRRSNLLAALAKYISGQESETPPMESQVVGKFKGKQPEIAGTALPHGFLGKVEEKKEE